jgi:hypothetical protein
LAVRLAPIGRLAFPDFGPYDSKRLNTVAPNPWLKMLGVFPAID